MKKLILPITVALIAAASCKETAYQGINMDQVRQLEDSIPTLIKGVSTIHTIQNSDYTNVTIIIGDVPFYSASPEVKQEAANRVGLALLRILGKENNISKATLVVTQNVKDNNDNPPDGIKTEIDIEALKKQ